MEAAQHQGKFVETITATAEATGRHVRQSSCPGSFAIIRLRVEPLAGSDAIEFVNALAGDVLPDEFIRATEKGARATLAQGIQEGVPVVAVRVTLLDGKHHEVDSSLRDFEVAGAMAVKEAVRLAQPIIIDIEQ